jgi:hypothetical protein
VLILGRDVIPSALRRPAVSAVTLSPLDARQLATPLRPAFSVVRHFDGLLLEHGVVDFPSNWHVQDNVQDFWAAGFGLIPRNAAAVDAILAVTA